MPTGSRAARKRPSRLASTNANMPLSWSSESGPWWSTRCSATSLSDAVSKLAWTSRSPTASWLYTSPLPTPLPNARRADPVAPRLVVVPLAVPDQPQIARTERLRPALDVDDRQAPVAEPCVVADRDAALVVRAAVNEPVEHPAAGRCVDRPVLSCDSAHDE